MISNALNLNKKKELIDERTAAELLLSVSPVIKPKASISFKGQLDPLESLASLASLETPVLASKHHQESNSPTRKFHALNFDSVKTKDKGHSKNTKCPSILGVKYQDIYNRGGRIGIYSPEERKKILERFKMKRSRRVWKKKIRYGCRKNLADQRIRVKGRFVKVDPNKVELPKQSESIVAVKEENKTVDHQTLESNTKEKLNNDEVSNDAETLTPEKPPRSIKRPKRFN